MDTAKIVREYILTDLVDGGERRPIGDDDDLLGEGIIDSMGVLRLVSFVEEQFEMRIPDEDVTVDNFRSLRALTDYLARAKIRR